MIKVYDVGYMTTKEIERLLFILKADIMNKKGKTVVNGKELS